MTIPKIAEQRPARYNAMVEAGDDTDFHSFGPGVRARGGFAVPPQKIAKPSPSTWL
ncbi:MAG: hypothetical protein R2729_22435 [Bryobacteraceae bacterium]